MKRIFLLLSFLWAAHTAVLAQLPNGSTAPNFTVTDVVTNQSYSLYSLLDQGKTVYLDFFATWCGPCWNYHNTHSLEDLWDQYGPPGTGEAFVIAIEGDAATNTACIFGPTGCNNTTQGDWTAGTPYPIADNSGVRAAYQITYYPTIMMICPADRKVYEVGQQGPSGLWSARSSYCPPLVVNTTLNSVQNVKCINTNTGAIDISVSGGSGPYTYNWSNGLHTQDLTNIPAGVYTCTVTNSQGWTGVTPAITVEAPPSPLALAVTDVVPVGCNGIKGALTVEASGGWPGNYTYAWNTGQGGPVASGLNPGTYTATVTDDNGCTKTLVTTLGPPSYPVATIAPPGVITCTAPNLQLAVTATGGGNNYNYQWFASNGGNIVSGATTANPTVNAAGNYSVQVTNPLTTCSGFAVTSVTANVALPTADAGPGMTVTCYTPSTVLQGTGSSGGNFSYLWTATNGGHIVSGANTLTPTVDAGGTYTLVVTNSTNGCTKNAATSVTGNNIPPATTATGDTLTCTITQGTVLGNTNAGDPGYAWTGPNSFTSTEQNPTIQTAGAYVLAVLDSLTGCVNTDTAMVIANTTQPGASATGGTITCVVTNVTLSGSSPSNNTSFAWTGPNGFTSTAQNPTVSDAGNYNLVVTYQENGCTSTAVAAVTPNTTPPAANATTPTNLNCQNQQIQLDGAGSAQGNNITYAWTTPDGNIVSGANTLTPVVDAPGAYQILVSNLENGCTATASTGVTQSAPVTAAISASSNVACHGGANGAATVAPGGGNSTYAYAWSNGNTTATASDLAAGTYVVTVTDGENCSASTAVVITQPEVLAANASATPQSAFGVNDGTASASPSGGTGAYAYNWSNGETTQTISGLAPGVYTVTVADENACTSVQIVTVNAFNCSVSAAISGTNITCAGSGNGSATLTLTGANEPVTYTWSNGANTSTATNLVPGTYTVEAEDVTNCAVILNITITEPLPLAANASATHETSAGANDGTATAVPTGGTSTYSYAWSNGMTTQTISNLAPDAYTVTITDANNCTAVQTVVVNSFNCVILAQPTTTNVPCAGQRNGIISLSLTGGTAPFTYVWSNGDNTATINNLGAGLYTVTITDANGCQVISGSAVTEPTPLGETSSTTHPVCANDQTGTIEVATSGGTMPYAYAWNNGANTNTISNLGVGAYALTTTDGNGCTLVSQFVLSASDNVPPVIAVQNTTLSLNASGTVTLSLAALGASITDNCAVASTSVEPSTFDCTQLGAHEVTIAATDGAGNASSSVITVTIVDDIAPSVTCPADLVRCWYENTVSYDAPVAQDNCLSSGGSWSQDSGLPSGSEFPVGKTTQTYSFKDASGNVGSCSFAVTITPPVTVAVTKVVNDVNNQGAGAISIDVTGNSEPYSYTWTKDGQFVGDTKDLTGIGEGTYEVKIRDANGCIVVVPGIIVGNTVHVIEPAWLAGVTMRPNPTNAQTRIVFAKAPASTLEVSVIDATGRILRREFSEQQQVITLDCSGLPEGIYLVRFATGNEIGVRRLMVSR